ncbi:MAG TPA: phosphotransferase [Acidimicrobiales bacterium]|nr:phosphotransferase [Acidimicrobiales bacterium]
MLAPADAELAARDPAIPGMALVLDEEALVRRLALSLTFAGVTSARATYVRYKPGTSCLVGYELGMGAQRVTAFAKAHRGDDFPKFSKTVSRVRQVPGVAFGDELVVVAEAGGDRLVPMLHSLSGHRKRFLMCQLLPDDERLWYETPRCVRYKPGRRWVGTVAREGVPVALIKGYRRDDLDRALAGLRLVQGTPVQAPRLLGACRASAALASEWVPGRSLTELLAPSGDPASALAATGQALRRLHDLPAAGLTVVPPEADAAAAEEAATALAVLLPHRAAMIWRLVGSLGESLLASTPALTSRHGDFSPDQVVMAGDDATLLDLDACATGDPAADLGSFLASVELTAVERSVDDRAVVTMAEQFLSGYAGAGGCLDRDRVAVHRGAHLLRLAVEPFRRRQPDWPERAGALVERAVGATSAATG